jgi:hypothetical protein
MKTTTLMLIVKSVQLHFELYNELDCSFKNKLILRCISFNKKSGLLQRTNITASHTVYTHTHICIAYCIFATSIKDFEVQTLLGYGTSVLFHIFSHWMLLS